MIEQTDKVRKLLVLNTAFLAATTGAEQFEVAAEIEYLGSEMTLEEKYAYILFILSKYSQYTVEEVDEMFAEECGDDVQAKMTVFKTLFEEDDVIGYEDPDYIRGLMTPPEATVH